MNSLGPLIIAFAAGLLAHRIQWQWTGVALAAAWQSVVEAGKGLATRGSLVPVVLLLLGIGLTALDKIEIKPRPPVPPNPIPGPVDPTPKPPGPTPPTPVPVVVDPPAPITETGLRVLFIEETADRKNLTPAQREILDSTAPGSVAAYLDSHCEKVNGQPEWRRYDKDQSLERESPVWKKAFALPRTSTPWMVASNGKTGYVGPLPATAAETLALLKKLGGE